MNTSQYMDKQIMDLSNSQRSNDFIDLKNPQEDHIAGVNKEEIVPSYDFQPIRPVGVSQPSFIESSNDGGARVWTSADSKINSSIRNYGSLDSIEPGKVISEKDLNVYDEALVSQIDRTMKKHADNLLHALEGVSARLSQLESRTRHIENSVDDLKLSVGNNQGSTDGKLRQLEVILREVQTDVEVVKDKQEIMEAQLNLAKLQIPKTDYQSETQNTAHIDPVQQHVAAASAPLQSHPQQQQQQLPPAAPTHPQHPTYPPPNAPPPPPSLQNPPPSLQLPNQFPPNTIPPPHQREPYYPPPAQTPEAPNQQYQVPPPPHPQPPPPALPQQQYQPPHHPHPHPHPQYSQPPPPQPQSPLAHQPEESPYSQSQNYPPSIRQPHSQPPPSGAPPPQQFYGAPPPMYEPPPPSRSSSGFSSGYGSGEQFAYGGPTSQYGSGSPMKSQQLASPSVGQSGGSGYPQLPTARILPHALPAASAAGGGSGSSGTGNRVPIDDVVDRVTNMGFPREQVRATVRKLTENGQSVDLNVVLDKLMNDGEGGNPQRGWFGR